MTPLLRELAPIPTRGSASSSKTSFQRLESADAIAHPTTPPPTMTMLACSMIFHRIIRCNAERGVPVARIPRSARVTLRIYELAGPIPLGRKIFAGKSYVIPDMQRLSWRTLDKRQDSKGLDSRPAPTRFLNSWIPIQTLDPQSEFLFAQLLSFKRRDRKKRVERPDRRRDMNVTQGRFALGERQDFELLGISCSNDDMGGVRKAARRKRVRKLAREKRQCGYWSRFEGQRPRGHSARIRR